MPVVERHGFDQHSMDKRRQEIDSSWDEDQAVVAPLMDRLKRLLGAE